MAISETGDYADGIAIIGIAGRFPGAQDLAAFWHNLREGVECVTRFTDQELLAAGVDPATLQHPQYVKAGAVLDDIALFDAAFFGFTPREAEILDPQQRLFLECAWEALERAGYDAAAYPGAIGVYAGTGMSTYLLANLYPNQALMAALGPFQVLLGNDKDFLPTRVSYKLNLTGPSINVNTAGSTSLVAIHLACQSLLNAECDLALAGGVSIRVPHRVGYWYQEGGVHSPDGHCRAFDAAAQGTVPGNGVGVVVLKRLAEARAHGDYIHAVIKGSAINNDGGLRESYTAPSVAGQAAVVAEALAMAEVEPETLTYVEPHGNATASGDPTEIAAFTQAFRTRTEKRGFCAVGSVKTNIGHLDAAAGIAGLIKTVLALQHRQIPPSLHYTRPNPQIDFATSPFYINAHLADWPAGPTPRRAGISALGIGGTNAHVVLEEAPPPAPTTPPRPWHLLLLSAQTDTALETATANLLAHLQRNPDLCLADVAYTLQIGRPAFAHRRALVVRDRTEALAALELCDPQYTRSGVTKMRERPVVLPSLLPAFAGQDDRAALLHSLAQLWLAGVPIDWAGGYVHERRQRLPLPTYPFERQRYWIDPPSLASASLDVTGESSRTQSNDRPTIHTTMSHPEQTEEFQP